MLRFASTFLLNQRCSNILTRPPTDPPAMYTVGLEKQEVDHDEVGLVRDTSSSIEEGHTSEEKLIRKVDLRLLPILGALYAISLVDRVNVKIASRAIENSALSVQR